MTMIVFIITKYQVEIPHCQGIRRKGVRGGVLTLRKYNVVYCTKRQQHIVTRAGHDNYIYNCKTIKLRCSVVTRNGGEMFMESLSLTLWQYTVKFPQTLR